MFGLPQSTEFNRRIPKQKFYENINVSASLKRILIEQVKNIYWRNKIATSTTNLASGSIVTEMEVFEIKLNNPNLDDSLLYQIDKKIPYHILFILEYQGKYQAWIGYKEATAASSSDSFKVTKYFHTEWLEENKMDLKLDGLDMDVVYENFVRKIAGDNITSISVDESLKDSIIREETKNKLQKQIRQLEKKAYSERQPRKKYDLVQRIKKLQKELEDC